MDNFRDIVIVLLCVALFLVGASIIAAHERIGELEYDIITIYTMTNDDFTFLLETQGEINKSFQDQINDNNMVDYQNSYDNAYYRCRIWHDIDILFGGGQYVEGRLNYPCSSKWYTGDK